jgi:hypothetical protein
MGGGGRLGAEATPLGESEGRDGEGVTTPCPRSPSPSRPTTERTSGASVEPAAHHDVERHVALDVPGKA